ncbi:MAG TPA: TonB family protein [Gemmatimonadaceae bacterium]|nr:TonB family protein [Gemmatimonadaceae bacterium]
MMRLLESKKDDKKRRSASGTIFSIILHVAIIFLAVFATARAGTSKRERVKAENVRFVAVKKAEPPPPPKEPPPPPKKVEAPKPKAPEPKVRAPELPKVETPAPPKGFQVVPPPVSVPTSLPSIDLSKVATNESDFSGKGVAGGRANGVEGGTGKEGDTGKEAGVKEDHGPYMEFQVEKPVEKIGGDSPEYPSALRESGVEGQVLAQFVVNESGRAEAGTLKILNSSNPQFTAAVKNALPRMKFSAAQIGGKKVQQLVQMPFQFHLSK